MQEIITRQDLQPINIYNDLVADFINYIDRPGKTTETYLTNLRQFIAWLHYAEVSTPTRADIIAYRDYLLSEHYAIKYSANATGYEYRTDSTGNRYKTICKPTTAAQYLRSVCQLFSWAAACGLYPNIAANIHAPKIDSKNHKKEALNAADVRHIENSIKQNAQSRTLNAIAEAKDKAGKMQRTDEQGKRLFALYLLAVNAGLRTIELSRANIKDIEVKNGKAVIYIWGKGHSGADQKKPLAPEVYQAITEYLKSRTDKYKLNSPLFVSTGNRSGGKRIEARTISQMLKKAMKEAGYNSERLTAHSLRHTTGTAVMQLSQNLYTTQKYMRHANPATTEIYLHNDTEKQEMQIAQQLYEFYHAI